MELDALTLMNLEVLQREGAAVDDQDRAKGSLFWFITALTQIVGKKTRFMNRTKTAFGARQVHEPH
jgi:hypothetical protein